LYFNLVGGGEERCLEKLFRMIEAN